MADGDEGALAELYRRYEPRVFAFAHQRLNDPAAASDLLNEVMLEVWRSASRFEGRSKVSTWILSIARHRAIDALRRRGERALREADEVDEALPAEEVSAEAALAAAGDTARLALCLERLSAAQRDAVHLAFFQDLPYPEIARAMDCPEGTVKTRIFHAKRALKRCLTRGGDDA